MDDLIKRVEAAKKDKNTMDALVSDYLPLLKKEVSGHEASALAYDERLSLAMLVFVGCVKQYDADKGNINNYVLYMGRLSILGFKKGLDGDSNDNSYGNKIAWSNGQNSARCRVRGTQNHQKNGTNSCKNRIGNRDFYYLDTAGNRQKGNTGSYNSEWCKDSKGDGPFGGNSVGKIYLNKYSWVNGGKRLRLECY